MNKILMMVIIHKILSAGTALLSSLFVPSTLHVGCLTNLLIQHLTKLADSALSVG